MVPTVTSNIILVKRGSSVEKVTVFIIAEKYWEQYFNMTFKITFDVLT